MLFLHLPNHLVYLHYLCLCWSGYKEATYCTCKSYSKVTHCASSNAKVKYCAPLLPVFKSGPAGKYALLLKSVSKCFILPQRVIARCTCYCLRTSPYICSIVVYTTIKCWCICVTTKSCYSFTIVIMCST